MQAPTAQGQLPPTTQKWLTPTSKNPPSHAVDARVTSPSVGGNSALVREPMMLIFSIRVEFIDAYVGVLTAVRRIRGTYSSPCMGLRGRGSRCMLAYGTVTGCVACDSDMHSRRTIAQSCA